MRLAHPSASTASLVRLQRYVHLPLLVCSGRGDSHGRSPVFDRFISSILCNLMVLIMPRPTSKPQSSTLKKPTKQGLPPEQTSPKVREAVPVIAAAPQAAPESDTESSPKPLQYDVPDMADVLAAFPQIKSIRRECNVPPMINKNDFNQVISSVKKIGMRDPIWVNEDGELLDGRARLAVAFLLQIDPKIKKTDEDPIDIAWISLARSHLSKGQKAVVASELLAMEREAATKRRHANLKKGNEIPERHNCDVRENETGRATEIAGRKAGVSRGSVERAAKLSPELKEKVRSNELTLNAAVKLDEERKKVASSPSGKVADADAPEDEKSSIEVLFKNERTTIYGHSQTSVQTTVCGPLEDGIWLLIRTDVDEICAPESKREAHAKARSILLGLVGGSSD